MLRVRLECERRFNIEFYGADSHSVTQLTSRDLAWNAGHLTCQHTSHIAVVAYISSDVTYVSSALQTLSVVCINDTSQDTPDKEEEIKIYSVYVGGYTETDTTRKLSPPTAWRQKLT